MNLKNKIYPFWISMCFFLTSISLYAQVDIKPWQFIEQNDFVKAKPSFEKELAKNPKSEDALIGLIFIAETVQDYQSYKKYVTQLIESNWKSEYLSLFKHLYDFDPATLIKKDIAANIKIEATMALADSSFLYKDFDKSMKLQGSVNGDYNWSLIGPFTNVAGSGHIEKNALEENAFDSKTIYKHESGAPLNWVQRKMRNPNGIVSFSSSLPYSYTGSYYANTFIDVPDNRELYLRIRRSTPLKIWLDGDLIFEQNDNINSDWDLETVSLQITKGIHRLLVKTSNYPKEENKSNISLVFNDRFDSGDGFNINNKYRSRSYNRRSSRGNNFAIRLTDKKGELYQDITSYFEKTSTGKSYTATTTEKELIQYFKNEITKNPSDLKHYYLLCKSYLYYTYTEEGEQFFLPKYEANKDKVFFKYLMAKLFTQNNKGVQAEGMISDLNENKTPLFAMMSAELDKIDKEKEEENYLATLSKLHKISPTNWTIINAYLTHYGDKGKLAEKKKFIQDFLVRFPDEKYKEVLEPYLKDDSYKPSSYKPITDKEREKNTKEALKRMKKTFDPSDYFLVIEQYKREEKIDEALDLYDELITAKPYRLYYRSQKANLLFEKDRLDDAISEYKSILNISPYNSSSHESIGDIYFEKGKKERALEYYKKTKALERYGMYNQSGSNSIEEKIKKIEEKDSYKEFFSSIVFDDMLKDEAWKEKYKDEESVISMYNIEAALDENNTLNYHQRMMIHIQNEAGAKYWTEANFSFLGDINFVKVIKKNGRVTSPDRNWRYVVFKNLEAGDIIQLEGNSSANMTRELPNQMFHVAVLSHDVPTYKSRFELIVPKDKHMSFECYRLNCDYEKRQTDNYDIYQWNNEHVEKVKMEEAIPDNLDSYAWIMMSTLKDWSDVVKWYLRKTYRRLELNYEVQNQLDEIVTDKMTDEEKVTSIYNYLTKEITYSYVSFLNSNYIPKKPSATLSDKIGDCKDVASLMIAMLRASGIDAHYVLVRTSNYTNSLPLATELAFNHVIVGYTIGGGEMQYLDMTTDFYPHYVIPEFDNHSWALLVKEGEDQLFRLPAHMLQKDKSSVNFNVKAKINTDRSLIMEVDATSKGVVGGKMRESLNRMSTEQDRKEFLTTYLGEGAFDHLRINDFQFENLEDITAPLNYSLNLKAFNHIERVSDFYIIQIPLMKSITTRPALFLEDRYNNLDLLPLFEVAPTTQSVDLEISTSFELMDVPENVSINNEFGTYKLNFKKTTNGLRIERDLMFKSKLIKHEDYQRFKEFYLELLDADRMKLAVRKRGS